MRAANEKYVDKSIKDKYGYVHRKASCPKKEKDLFGYPIQVGAFVIWQPYSAHEGMHIGQVKSLGHDDWIEIKTADNKTITRHGYELVLLLQQQMRHQYLNDETLY